MSSIISESSTRILVQKILYAAFKKEYIPFLPIADKAGLLQSCIEAATLKCVEFVIAE